MRRQISYLMRCKYRKPGSKTYTIREATVRASSRERAIEALQATLRRDIGPDVELQEPTFH